MLRSTLDHDLNKRCKDVLEIGKLVAETKLGHGRHFGRVP